MEIVQSIPESYFVGGCVRDLLMGCTPNDFDVEVFNTTYDKLVEQLKPFGQPNFVGKSFGIVKLHTTEGIYDFALPRTETRVGAGHRGFTVQHHQGISLQQAARRRDFTINALHFDPRAWKVIDSVGGLEDLHLGILRHTSPAFSEDILRPLRGMQFASRFNLHTAPETIKLCRSIRDQFHTLTSQRVWKEWQKWAGLSTRPSRGLQFLKDTGWIQNFPALASLHGVEQDPQWHPEGDVLVHTGLVCDALATDPEWQQATLPTKEELMFGALLHDIAKPETTEHQPNGRITSYRHAEAGMDKARDFLASIDAPNDFQQRVPLLVGHHMDFQTPSPRTVRRLAQRIHPVELKSLLLLMRADHQGRGPASHIPEEIQQIAKLAQDLQLEASKPIPIIMGRHLVERGMQPGPEFTPILKQALSAQLDGEFHDLDSGQQWLDQHLALRSKEAYTIE